MDASSEKFCRFLPRNTRITRKAERERLPADGADDRRWIFTGENGEHRIQLTIRVLQIFAEGNEGNEDQFLLDLTGFVLLADSGIGLYSQSAYIRVIRGKVIPLFPLRPPVKSKSGLVAVPPRWIHSWFQDLRNLDQSPGAMTSSQPHSRRSVANDAARRRRCQAWYRRCIARNSRVRNRLANPGR